MAQTGTARTDELPEGLPLRIVHDELIRIEAHWTTQVQNQQTRILAILTVNSFALAFLTAAGFRSTGHGTAFKLFSASLVVLTLALIVGMAGLIPQTKIGGGGGETQCPPPKLPGGSLWLDSYLVWGARTKRLDGRSSEALSRLCESIAQNQNWNRKHAGTLRWRRLLVRVQLAFIVVGMGILVAAIGYRI